MATWTGDRMVMANIGSYANKVEQVTENIALYWGPVLENYAKQNATWEDRTPAARPSLYWRVIKTAGKVTLYLSHGVDYGLWLEVANSGKYAIIWATVEAHIEDIRRMVKGVFRG